MEHQAADNGVGNVDKAVGAEGLIGAGPEAGSKETDGGLSLARIADESLNVEALLDAKPSLVIESSRSDAEPSTLENWGMTNKATKIGYVTTKGMAGVPLAAVDAFAHDLDNPENLAAKIGGGLAFGAAMRGALAKSGTGRAVAGGVFGFFMVKDALVPLSESYSQAWDASTVAELNRATDTFSTGMGHFTYDVGLTLGAANAGERLTERAMKMTMKPTTYAKFEAYKQEMWTSDNHILGATINGASRSASRIKTSISEKLGLSTDASGPGPRVGKTRLSELEVEARAGEGLAEYKHHVGEKQTYSRGLPLKTGERIGLSETVALLEQGINPRAVTLGEAQSALKLSASDFKGLDVRPEIRSLNGPEPGKGVEPGKGIEPGKGKETGTRAEGEGPAAEVRSDKAEAVGAKDMAAKVESETNPANITEMSKLMKEQMKRWDEEGMLVADRVEGDIGPVYSALKTDHVPLDPGYGVAARQMFGLAEQVKRGEDYQQVGTLFGYLRDATNQWNLGNATRSAQLAQELNLLSIEIHTGLKQGLRRAGLKPDEILDAKNPPLFTVRNDGGAGPHTIPEIQGVWDVDVVLWPRNMMGARSTATSGINGHEIGHNQYGGLLRFEESIRDSVIGNAVAKGLESFKRDQKAKSPEAKVSETVEVPGHGQVSKQDLYEGILKAQANENTSDIWGTAWTGPNSALSLGVLLQSLRRDGKLENRNVFGEEYVGPGNQFGFEVHGMDRFRVLLSAEVLRQRSNGDPLVLEYAKSLDRYAEVASREGDYTWASLESPGKSVTVPRAEFEAMIPDLVRVQLNQPLPALEGKTFGEILPDLPTHVRKMNDLADIIVDGAKAGRDPSVIPFDVNTYTINQVFGSGMPAALRLMAEGMSAKDATAWVNRYSDHFRAQYLKLGNPHTEPIGPTFNIQQLQLDPVHTVASTSMRGLENLGKKTHGVAERYAPTLSGYPGGMLGEGVLQWKDSAEDEAMDKTRQQIVEDDKVKKQVLGE